MPRLTDNSIAVPASAAATIDGAVHIPIAGVRYGLVDSLALLWLLIMYR